MINFFTHTRVLQKRHRFFFISSVIFTLQLSNEPVTFSKSQIPSALHRFFNQDEENIIVSGLQCENSDEVVREAAHRLHYYFDPRIEGLLSR